VKYRSGEEVKVGDKVRIGSADFGVVVGVIEDGSYAQGYPISDWSYLEVGLLVVSRRYGLLHYPEFDGEIDFLARSV